MSNPLIAFLTTAPAAVTAGSEAVSVSTDNPLPVAVISGGGGGGLEVTNWALTDAQPNTAHALVNNPADTPRALAVANSVYDPVAGAWQRFRGQPGGMPVPANRTQAAAVAVPASATTTIIAAPGAGRRLYISGYVGVPTAASAQEWTLGDGVMFYNTLVIPAVANRFVSVVFATPIPLGTNLPAQITSIAGNQYNCYMWGFVGD